MIKFRYVLRTSTGKYIDTLHTITRIDLSALSSEVKEWLDKHQALHTGKLVFELEGQETC